MWLQGHAARASLLCSVGKIFHCVHYLSAAPRMYICRSVCLCVCPMNFFENLSKKWTFHQILTKIISSVREGQCVFTVAYNSIVLIMRYNADKHNKTQHKMLFCINSLLNSWHFYDNVEKKNSTARQPQMTIWLLRISCRVLKATNTLSQYVIIVAFTLKQWSQEHAPMLLYTYIACLFHT